jgi:hypothetical protein
MRDSYGEIFSKRVWTEGAYDDYNHAVRIFGPIILMMRADPRRSWTDVIRKISDKGIKVRSTLPSKAIRWRSKVLVCARATKPPPGS